MIHVWKCGYCSDVREDKGDAAEHEKICTWNPKTRSCWACRNRKTYGIHCYAGVHLEDNYISDCEKWVTDEI